MQVSVIGAGYVGLVTAAGLAHLGHRVKVGEIQQDRVDALRAGKMPLYEQGLDAMLERASERGLISYHSDNLDAVEGSEFVFCALPTPSSEDGRADMSFVMGLVDQVAPVLTEGAVLVIKSTVPVGSAERIALRLDEMGSTSKVVSNPEFLREGNAVEDFLRPDRIVVGAFDRREGERVSALFDGVAAPVIHTDPTSAEMIKYGSNAYLAARITFANALAALCEVVGADILSVTDGMGRDKRIGPYFLQPGPGFGGSCFPKDTQALISIAADAGYDFALLQAVIDADHAQRRRIVGKVRESAGGTLRDRRVALWGLAFKAGTDDTRESPALRVARMLKQEGAEVVAFDPEARSDEVRNAPSAVEAAEGADVLLVATEWPEFIRVDLAQVAAVMRRRQVVDARNLLRPEDVRAAGLAYQGLGRPRA